MKQQRLSLCLSATALLVAVFGSTPLGQAATRAVHSVIPPYAKTAGYAKVAGNAALLNGHKAASTGTPGTVVVVGASGKLPASIGAVGPAGPAGPAGVSGYIIVRHDQYLGYANETHLVAIPGEADCPAGKKVVGGTAWVHEPASIGFGVLDETWELGADAPKPDGSAWVAVFVTGSGPISATTTGTVEAICATVN
jgi:hypothetical protein